MHALRNFGITFLEPTLPTKTTQAYRPPRILKLCTAAKLLHTTTNLWWSHTVCCLIAVWSVSIFKVCSKKVYLHLKPSNLWRCRISAWIWHQRVSSPFEQFFQQTWTDKLLRDSIPTLNFIHVPGPNFRVFHHTSPVFFTSYIEVGDTGSSPLPQSATEMLHRRVCYLRTLVPLASLYICRCVWPNFS